MIFTVTKREIWIQDVEIEAESKEEAIDKVSNGSGEIIQNHVSYSHDLPIEEWTAQEGRRYYM